MFLDPGTVVANFQITHGMSVADFGAGAGHFAFAMADAVGLEGRVYALDIREEMIEVLNGYIRLHNIPQITPMQCNLETKNGSTLTDQSVDAVLCAGILHQVDNPFAVLQEAFRVLKSSGTVVIIDWDQHTALKPGKLFAQPEAQNTLSQCGFTLKEVLKNAGDYHYGVVGEKKITYDSSLSALLRYVLGCLQWRGWCRRLRGVQKTLANGTTTNR